jgi:hypothetical protein
MKKTLLCITTLFTVELLACGGGLTAYIPSDDNSYVPSEGESSLGNTNVDFYIIDKGVSSSMFDVKSLQPVFRNSNESGNQRNEKNISERVKERQLEEVAKAQQKADSSATGEPFHEHGGPGCTLAEEIPVLNLHKVQ